LNRQLVEIGLPNGLRKYKNHSAVRDARHGCQAELELELIQTQMTQKPVLRAEVYARALRASQNRK
jgi:hypothetical protein